jgi:P-type Cu+ transporter
MTTTTTLKVKGMTGDTCVSTVQNTLKNLPGVIQARAILDLGTVDIDFDPSRTGLDDMVEELRTIGYEAEVGERQDTSDQFFPDGLPGHADESSDILEAESSDVIPPHPPSGAITPTPAGAPDASAPTAPASPAPASRNAAGFHALEPASVLSIDSPKMADAVGAALFAGLVFAIARMAPDVAWAAWVQLVVAGIVQFGLGFKFYASAGRALMHLKIGMNTLVVIATTSLYAYSVYHTLHGGLHVFFDVSTAIIAFVGIGRVLEEHARQSVARAVPDLLRLKPKNAFLIKLRPPQSLEPGEPEPDDLDEEDEPTPTLVPVEQLTRGDVISVKPGQHIPADGIVLKGASTVDQSMLTGETRPLDAAPGIRVLAGTINLSGTLIIQAQRVGESTYLSQLVDLVQNIESQQPRMQRLTERFASIMIFLVLAIALATFLVWGLKAAPDTVNTADVEVISPWVRGMLAAVAVIIIGCPCALGLAVPTSVMVAISLAARQGLLIRNPDEFEKAARLTHIILDQPGALSLRRPTVSNIIPLDTKHSEGDIIQLAANVEQFSEDPIAAAILAAAKRMSLPLEPVTDPKTYPHAGVTGVVRGLDVAVGSPTMMRDLGIKGIGDASLEAMVLRRKGKSPVFVAVSGRVVGVIAMADQLKRDSALTVTWLRRLGVHPYVLTADTPEAGIRVVKKLGLGKGALDPNDYLMAEVDSHDKSKKVEGLRAGPGIIAFAGNGTQDRDAIDQSHVGIAVVSQSEAGGADNLHSNSGGIILMGNGLWSLIELVRLARMTRYRAQMGLFWAIAFNVLLIPIAAVGWLPPIIAPIAMSLSTLCVMANAMWLRTAYQPSRPDIGPEDEPE